jgi:hypothetical protein
MGTKLDQREHTQVAARQMHSVKRAAFAGDLESAAIIGGELQDTHRLVTRRDSLLRRGRQWKQTPREQRSRK